MSSITKRYYIEYYNAPNRDWVLIEDCNSANSTIKDNLHQAEQVALQEALKRGNKSVVRVRRHDTESAFSRIIFFANNKGRVNRTTDSIK